MTDSDLCRSLLHAIAGNPCPVNWNATAIQAAGLLLLWDDQPEATSPIVKAVDSHAGELVASCCIDRGPHGRPMLGAGCQRGSATLIP